LIPWISKEVLKGMLIRENETRLSSEMQMKYREAEDSSTTDWMSITIAMQRKLVQDQLHLAADDEQKISEALYALRTAHLAYPEEAEFRTIPLYIKYNITRFGVLAAGDAAPNPEMLPVVTTPSPTDPSRWQVRAMASKKLLDVAPFDRPHVLIAGSYT